MQSKEFGEYLRQLRNKRGLTIRQVETYSDVSNGYLSQIETGKRGIPSARILKKLAPILKVPCEELMIVAGYLEREQPDPTEFEYTAPEDKLSEILSAEMEAEYGQPPSPQLVELAARVYKKVLKEVIEESKNTKK